MHLKTFVLLLVLGMSLALPQEGTPKKEAPKEEAPKKVEAVKPVDSKLEAKPEEIVPVEEELPLEEEIVDPELTEEERLLEEGGDILVDEEVPVEEELEEFSCEYTDAEKNEITVYFSKDEQGLEQATEILPAETQNIDDKLKECLQQDLTGRRNVKRRRPAQRRRPNKRRKPANRRKGGKRRPVNSGTVLQDIRKRISGHPNSVTVREMKLAIKLAQRYIAVKGKEARKKKIMKRRKQG